MNVSELADMAREMHLNSKGPPLVSVQAPQSALMCPDRQMMMTVMRSHRGQRDIIMIYTGTEHRALIGHENES